MVDSFEFIIVVNCRSSLIKLFTFEMLLFFIRFMHQQANRVIRAVFEYWSLQMPEWSSNEKLISLCFDEMNIDNLGSLHVFYC